MSTTPVQGLFVHTTSWDATLAFWQRLGYQVEFQAGPSAGRLRHPDGGPYLFVVEDPSRAGEGFLPVLDVDDAADASGSLTDATFEPTHWGTRMAHLQDPEGRPVALEAGVTQGDAA